MRKMLLRSERRAEKKVKESKKKRVRKRFHPYPGYDFCCRASSDSTWSDSRGLCLGSWRAERTSN